MLGPEEIDFIRQRAAELARRDGERLERLREEVRALRGAVRRIYPRTTTTVSLVATDAGEEIIEFDPHLFFPVRVVDSQGRVIFRDLLTPWMDVEVLNRQHLEDGQPKTPLGRLMADLGVSALWELSPMIPDPATPLDRRNRRWIQDYRDLGEWAALYDYLTGPQEFATDTLIVRDGFLRSKLFAGDHFARMWERMEAAVERRRRETGRRLFVAGIAKRSKVLDRYHLALFLEGVLVQPGACAVRIPPTMERQVYRWAEYAPGEEGEARKFVAGVLHLVKFGSRPEDPIWAVDVWERHVRQGEVDEIFGYLLGDAQVGFPIPFYPLCLQRAHEQARLGGLDAELLQDLVLQTIREQILPDRPEALVTFRLLAGGRRKNRDGRE